MDPVLLSGHPDVEFQKELFGGEAGAELPTGRK